MRPEVLGTAAIPESEQEHRDRVNLMVRIRKGSGEQKPVGRERVVRLPQSGPNRQCMKYCKLLSKVDQNTGPSGYAFHGKIFRPGLSCALSSLRPSPEYPEVPVLLECAGPIEPAKYELKGMRDVTSYLYILWQLHGSTWVELARTQSTSSTWTLDLAHVARRALSEGGAQERQPLDMSAAANRIMGLFEREVEGLDGLEKWDLACLLHDSIAAQVAYWTPR